MRTLRRSSDLGFRWCGAWAIDASPRDVSRPVFLDDLGAFDRRCWVDNRLNIWLGAPREDDLPGLLAGIADCERDDVTSLLHPADRAVRAAGRGVARWLLSRLLDCAPVDVAIFRGPHGKPLLDCKRHGLAAHSLHFNVSHVRGLVAVAIGPAPLGVDIELVRTFPDMQLVARQHFAPEMLGPWEATMDQEERTAHFYRFWTLGEAFIKATGQGLSQNFRSFAFPAKGEPRLLRVDDRWGPPSRWSFGIF